jgi:predicted nuclease of predicted toxin-antitoxin system
VVFTHDLDFGGVLALTHAAGPSVIQVRSEDPVPEVIGVLVASGNRGTCTTPDRWRAAHGGT